MMTALASAVATAVLMFACFWVGTRSLRRRADQWHTILGGMPDGLMVVDRNLRLVEWNKNFPEFVGVEEQSLSIGMPLAEILRIQAKNGEFGEVDIDEEVDRRLKRFLSGEASGTVERRRPNGRVMELRRRQVAGGGFVTLYTDITDKRGVEEQLRQAQKMQAIGRLTSGLAHDFNNLLAIVIGNLELAQTALETSNALRAQHRLEDARAGADRAAKLTQQLLAFSRRQILQPQSVDPNRIIVGMSNLIRHSLGGIQLETVLDAAVWQTYVDPHQLENALLNLAINARDAMPDGGKVTIETANSYLDEAYAAANEEVEAGQYVLIAVSDRGVGMSGTDLARAFEPFFTTKEIGKGSGLGLSQVFGFIKQSQGHVKIYSELGSGTTVKIYLPRLREDASVADETIPDPSKIPYARNNEVVLIVEDDAGVLDYTKNALESLGYHVIAAKDPATALATLDLRPEIALILTDVGLPGLSGPEMAQTVRQRQSRPPILYMTGYPVNDMLDRNLTNSDTPVIAKPFALAELARAMRAALERPAE
jgi:signal transduction histidine kinase